jgi:hypothetical protein
VREERLLGEQLATMLGSIGGRFELVTATIEIYSSPDARNPSVLERWPMYRRNLKAVVDYDRKNRGRIPPRLNWYVDRIRSMLAERSEHPTIPGSPWSEIQEILSKIT